MVTNVFKQKVIDKLKEQEKLSGMSSARFSVTIGINKSQWSRLRSGELEGVLADSKFITLARENGIELGQQSEWKTVATPVFSYISVMLQTCQRQHVSSLLVDMADIGKSHTAKHYARNTRNAIYVDCSQVKSKQLFVRDLARQLGVSNTGRYSDVYRDLVYYMNTIDDLLIILDEAGDLKYDAFLELKALWNATEGNVAWVMMGADGLKSKINRSINCQKVGFTEIFRRYGSTYKKITPMAPDELSRFNKEQALMIAKANAPEGCDINKLVTSVKVENDLEMNRKLRQADKSVERYSLTNVYNRIMVMNRKNG